MRTPPERDERGLNESLQWALLLPVVLLVLLGILQTAIWLHARQSAQHAAVAAAEAAAVWQADVDAAERAARKITNIAGLREVDVVVESGPTELTVTVSGRPQMIIDIGPTRVTQRAVISPERVSQP